MRKKIFIAVDATVQFIVKFEVMIYLNIKDECLKFPKIKPIFVKKFGFGLGSPIQKYCPIQSKK